jgi:hypothetical protein
MGGGSQNQNTSQTYTPNAQAMGAFTNVMQGAAGIANRNQTWNPEMAQRVAGQNQMQLQGYSGIQGQLGQYSPQVNEALGMTSASGQNITGEDIARYQSPYTQQVINATMANAQQQQGAGMQNVVGNQIAQNAQGGDRAMLQKALTQGQYAMANNQTIANLEQQGYNTALATAQGEKGRQLQAGMGLMSEAGAAQNYNLQGLGALIGAGGALQGQQQSEYNAATQNATSQTMWPMQLQQWLAGITGSMGSLMGGTTTGTGKTEEHPGFYNYLGAGMGGLSAMSDERVKENKKVVGELFDGQKVYAYNYKGDPTTQLGLMAQEVERHHPESVGQTEDGIKTVQYDMATDRAAKRGNFADGGTPGFGGSDPWNSANSPWGGLIQGSPQVHSGGFSPPVAAGTAPAPMSSKDAEQRQQTQQGKQGGQGAKDIWNKYLNKGQTPSTGTTGSANGWEAQTVPSSELGGSADVTVTTPAATTGESATGFGGAGFGGSSPAAAAPAGSTAVGGTSAAPIGAMGSAPSTAAAAPVGEAATGFAGAAPAVSSLGGAGVAGAVPAGAGLGAMGAGAGAAGAGAAGAAGAGAAGAGAAGAGAAGAAGAGAAGAGTAAAGSAAAGAAGAAGGSAGGGLAALIGALFSDERMKENKRVVGRTFDGQNIYAYNYKGHPMTQLGLMAQEVERRHPEAVGEQGGMKTVQYDRAIKTAARKSKFADGGDVGSNDEMRRRAEHFLNLASGGAVHNFADGGDVESLAFEDPALYDIDRARVGMLPDVQAADTRALPDEVLSRKPIESYRSDIGDDPRNRHEERTHFQPYLRGTPAEKHKLPGARDEFPPLAGGSALTGEAARARGIVTNSLYNAPMAYPESKSHLGDVDRMPPVAGAKPSATWDRPVPPIGTMAPVVPDYLLKPGDASPEEKALRMSAPEWRARGYAGEPRAGEDQPAREPLLPPTQSAEIQRQYESRNAGLSTSPTMARGRYVDAARGLTSNLRLPARADVSELLRSARGAGEMAADYVSPGARMEREQAADAAGEFRWNPAAGRSEFISGEQLAREAATPRQGVPGEPIQPGTAQGEAPPPMPERNIIEKARHDAEVELAATKARRDAAYGHMSEQERLNAQGALAPVPGLPERNIIEKSRHDAEVEAAQAKVDKLNRYAEWAQNAVRLNAPSAGGVTPEAAAERAHADRAAIMDTLKQYFPYTFGGEPIAPAGVTPKTTGPEAFLTSEYGEEPVAPHMVRTAPAEHTPFTARQANKADVGATPVPGESRSGLTDAEKLAATKVEPYSAAVGAPKAQTFQEQEPGRYGAGAQASMTKRLKFENDLGGVTRDTGGNPSMGNYGILARKGGNSSASDFYDNYGEKLGFTHDPRHDPWGFAADWKRIAKDNPQGLEAAEEAWHNRFIKGSVRAHVLNAGLPTSLADDRRVQEYFQDRYVQHGTGISKDENGRNGAGRLKQAWAKAEGDIPTFLKNMSAIDKAHIRHDFETYLSEHPDHQGGLEKRISNRLAGALGEKVQPGGTSEQVTQAASDKKETAANTPKSAAELLPHEQNQVGFIQKILGGWNPLEGITGPGKDGKDSWNPLGLTSDQRRNLMMVGLQMAGGSPLGMRALAGGASGMAQAQQMQMNEHNMGVQRAKLALEAMNQPKFSPVHWTDFMGMQHAGSMDVHSGAITEAGQTAPVPAGSIAPGTVQADPGAAGAPGAAGTVTPEPTGDAQIDQMFKQYPQARGTVEGLLDGRFTLQQIPTRQRAGMEMAANAVAASRGDVYDPVKIQKQSDFEKKFLDSESKTGTEIKAINRASEHIGQIMDVSAQLGNDSVGRYMSGKLADNFTPMRDPQRERFRVLGRAIASELSKMESGGKGAQKTTEEWESMFDPSLPKAVRDANIMEAFGIMKGNMKGLDQAWINGARKGRNGPTIDYMAPEVRRNMHTAQLRYEQATGRTPEGTKSTVEKPPAPIPEIREQLGRALKKADTPEKKAAILDRAKKWGVYGLETQQ